MLEVFNQVEGRAQWISLGLLGSLLAWETLHPYWSFFRGHLKDRLFHAVRNLVLGVLNALMIAVVFLSAWHWAAETAFARGWGLLNLLQLEGWLRVAAALLLLDFWTYWWHRFNHEWPFLWRFHRVHHSDNRMDVTTANRFHFGEILMSSLLRVTVILLIGAELWHLAIYEAVMFPIVQFHHANIWVGSRFDRILRIFIVTPAMHKVHHSRYQPETDSNYTSLLSIWDRIFGTFRLNQHPEAIEVGLDGYDDGGHQSVRGLIKTPMEKKPVKSDEA